MTQKWIQYFHISASTEPISKMVAPKDAQANFSLGDGNFQSHQIKILGRNFEKRIKKIQNFGFYATLNGHISGTIGPSGKFLSPKCSQESALQIGNV